MSYLNEPSPDQTVSEMHEYADAAAEEILAGMTDEEAITMVRDFCTVIAKWQPNIDIYKDEPVMLGLSCLSAAQLFRIAFGRAYRYTDKKLAAQQALEKVFNKEDA